MREIAIEGATVEGQLLQMNQTQIELRNAIRGKTDRCLERKVRTIDSPFTAAVLECPMPSKFHLPHLEPFHGLKDPLDHLNTFKTIPGLQ